MCAPGGIRTHNQRLRRPVLCPLSYGGNFGMLDFHCSGRKPLKTRGPLSVRKMISGGR
jgi:hypothetical protein